MPVIYFNYLTVNGLHYVNKVLISIHRNKQRRESNVMNEYDLAKSLNEKQIQNVLNSWNNDSEIMSFFN